MTPTSHASDLLRLTVEEDGQLRMTLLLVKAEDKSDLLEQYNEFGEVDTLAHLLEPFSTNGSFSFIDGSAGNPDVGLTSAPCIAEGLQYDDDGKAEIQGRLWWFPNYAMEGVIDTLLEQGDVLWAAAPGSTPASRRGRSP